MMRFSWGQTFLKLKIPENQVKFPYPLQPPPIKPSYTNFLFSAIIDKKRKKTSFLERRIAFHTLKISGIIKIPNYAY